MIELFGYGFFQNAFIVSIVLALIYGIFSFFVVTRKMAFLGVGIAHTAFGGVALGVLLGVTPFWVALVFCVLGALLISGLEKRKKLSFDSGIGILFSVAMALGAIFLSLKKGYTFDISGYLFGNILGIQAFDRNLAIIGLGVFLPFIGINFRRLLFLSFDEEAAYTAGVNTGFLDSMLLILFAGIIVISIKLVGIILVSALAVLPASFGLLFSKNYRSVIGWSTFYALIVMLGGLFLSYYLNSPTGATIVVLGAVLYFGCLGVRRLAQSAGRSS